MAPRIIAIAIFLAFASVYTLGSTSHALAAPASIDTACDRIRKDQIKEWETELKAAKSKIDRAIIGSFGGPQTHQKCTEYLRSQATEIALSFAGNCEEIDNTEWKSYEGKTFSPDTLDATREAILIAAKRECKTQSAEANTPVLTEEEAAAATPITDDSCLKSSPLEKNEVKLVPPGCLVSGDVSTGPSENGPWHFEGKRKADDGTIVFVNLNPTWVKAANPASMYGMEPEKAISTIKKVGCTRGCSTVTVVYK